MSLLRHVAVIAMTGAIMACSPQLSDLRAYTDQIKQQTQVNIEPYPEFEQQPAFAYTASDLRSPFVRPKEKTAPVNVQAQANCLQPDYNRQKQKLEGYGLDALRLNGSFETRGTRYVLFRSNDGQLHKATMGSRIGLFYGKIIAIGDTSVTIEQLLPDGAGCWQRKETTLTVASSTGENENV
ncbi:pilus assembly protein PilP [Alteromonas halophila]|uniref:Pilus assembly protein PilP n=1 Tax=Alteromonas halophila TaxID=516698 RepID=A0A918JFW9_9ALTE|nr:pilus assembly protein PilP [Alteromonas halophila]GGW78869.1 pilus assembly protein PilP [Alteromonas halophila]